MTWFSKEVKTYELVLGRTEDESETDHGSLRKSVSFCEDVDVVNIKTMPTKSARQSNKRSKYGVSEQLESWI